MAEAYSIKIYEHNFSDNTYSAPLFTMDFDSCDEALSYIIKGSLDEWFDDKLHCCNIYDYRPISDGRFLDDTNVELVIDTVYTMKPFVDTKWRPIPYRICIEKEYAIDSETCDSIPTEVEAMKIYIVYQDPDDCEASPSPIKSFITREKAEKFISDGGAVDILQQFDDYYAYNLVQTGTDEWRIQERHDDEDEFSESYKGYIRIYEMEVEE